MKKSTPNGTLVAILITMSISMPANAGWNPIRDIQNGLKTVRMVVDSDYRKKQERQAKNRARHAIAAEKSRQLGIIDQTIAKLTAEIRALQSDGEQDMNVQLKKAELDLSL